MKKWRFLLLLGLFLFAAVLTYFYFTQTQLQKQTELDPKIKPAEQESQEQNRLYYPISRYRERLTFRWFGKFVSSTEKAPGCGASFSGYHNADDLEVFDNEAEANIPVYSAVAGKVERLENANGYGGLVVISAEINGQFVTMNYGHINLASAKVKVGDQVAAGQELAFLGRGCSAETGGERKHLHFAIHKGPEVDIRGYLSKNGDLISWINPKEFLSENKAVEVK